MGIRLVLLGVLFVAQVHCVLCAQVGNATVRSEYELLEAFPLKRSVLPVEPVSWPPNLEDHDRWERNAIAAPVLGVNPTVARITSTNAFVPNVGRNFEGNHLTGGTPSDNTMAISNSGLIVSADNYSIAYFKENGDTITQFGLPLRLLYNDSTMNRDLFDPRVIYDRYADRFILVSLYHSVDYQQSKMLISFSDPLVADTVEWNHFEVNCDTVFNAAGQNMYWFDYPNISVTQSQFLVAVAVRKRDSVANTNYVESNLVLQVNKADGYAGQPLSMNLWRGVQNAEGDARYNMVPAMDALQGVSYDTLSYMVSSYTNSSSKFFWFEIHGAVGSPNAQIIAHGTFPAFYYAAAPYASQLGGDGGDRIRIVDCDIQYCLVQNGKLHFVFTRSNTGWSELVYANIEMGTNTFSYSTFDRVSDEENLLLPSIACYGVDSTDENYLIGFLRTGPNQFPEVCVINYDSMGWSIVPQSVKQGFGLIDLRPDLVAPWDSMERWGDYTCIQRRYDDPYRRCWMVGAHAFGLGANHFGITSGVNAWIAEIGDSLPALDVSPMAASSVVGVYPSPVSTGGEVTVRIAHRGIGMVELYDAVGQMLHREAVSGGKASFDTDGFSSGIYFVRVILNGMVYGQEKFVVCD